jgi:hypothetical protein
MRTSRSVGIWGARLHPAAVAQPGATAVDGQLVGQLGNSGSSSAPHVHLHASAVPWSMTAQDMIEAHRAGDLPGGAYRPLPFRAAQAMRLSDVHPVSEGPNPFAVLTGHGLYFDKSAVWPGTTTPGVSVSIDDVATEDHPCEPACRPSSRRR